MTASRPGIKSDLKKVDAHRIAEAEYDDAPELTDEQLADAVVARPATRGRPPSPNPKQAVKLRLDADVIAAYRKTGTGWQTRINEDLRKARKLPTTKSPTTRKTG
ncbi:MAG: BrnA antitoxin family protein [Xanthobacteraceae bacterium]|nr:BrnA antitoxin family protein [Xanthobacteraceae bacterium]